MFIEKAILLAYGITIVSETFLILILQRPQRWLSWIVGIFLINSLTHPLVVYCLQIRQLPYIAVEILVCIIEMLLYRLMFRISWMRSCVFALVANVFSIVIGIGIRFILGI